MVRFSDMLGASDNPEPPPTTSAPIPDPPAADSPSPDTSEPDDAQEEATPEEVLDRLTQYAAGHIEELPTHVSGGDDLLPRGKSGKGRKRR